MQTLYFSQVTDDSYDFNSKKYQTNQGAPTSPLQWGDTYEANTKEKNLTEFHKYLPGDEYVPLKSCACEWMYFAVSRLRERK